MVLLVELTLLLASGLAEDVHLNSLATLSGFVVGLGGGGVIAYDDLALELVDGAAEAAHVEVLGLQVAGGGLALW